jgi:hypothetical protein
MYGTSFCLRAIFSNVSADHSGFFRQAWQNQERGMFCALMTGGKFIHAQLYFSSPIGEFLWLSIGGGDAAGGVGGAPAAKWAALDGAGRAERAATRA